VDHQNSRLKYNVEQVSMSRAFFLPVVTWIHAWLIVAILRLLGNGLMSEHAAVNPGTI
jgi:hypothetical protein